MQEVQNLKENIFCGYSTGIFLIFELNRNSLFGFSIKFLSYIPLALGETNQNHEIGFDDYSAIQYELLSKRSNFAFSPIIKILMICNENSFDKFYIIVSSKNCLYWLCKNNQNELSILLTIVKFFNCFHDNKLNFRNF